MSFDVLKRGHKGPEVEALQSELNALGCACEVDGVFGHATEGAVKHFQTAYGLTADGMVGPQTRETLQEALAARGEDE